MFYTKYRPQKFSDVAKPNKVADALAHQVASNKYVHAYLFVGPRGVGKTTLARIFAKALNCEKLSKSGDPCDKCDSCISIKNGNFVDLIEIDAASNRGIDDVRELKDRIYLSPSIGTKKVYIVDEVHMLTREAFNALLKTLEEPPTHVVFILCTTELHKVPDTIKSRCQLYKLKRASIKQLTTKLSEISKNEGFQVSDEDLKKIAEASFGGYRDAETMLQQVIEGNMDASSFAGLNSKQLYNEFFNAIISKDQTNALNMVKKVVEEGFDLNVWVYEFLNFMRDILYIKNGAGEELADDYPDMFDKLSNSLELIPNSLIVSIIDEFITMGARVNSSSVKSLPIEIAIIKLTAHSDDDMSANEADPDNIKPKNTTTKPFNNSSKKLKNSSSRQSSDRPSNTSATQEASIKDDDNDLSKIQSEEKKEDSNEITTELEVLESDGTALLDFTVITSKWKQVVQAVVPLNSSIHALLKSAEPVEVVGAKLVVEVSFKFHKERLESNKNRKLVEGVLQQIYSVPLVLECKINEAKRPKTKPGEVGELTDHNVVPASFGALGMSDATDVADIFDGALPL